MSQSRSPIKAHPFLHELKDQSSSSGGVTVTFEPSKRSHADSAINDDGRDRLKSDVSSNSKGISSRD